MRKTKFWSFFGLKHAFIFVIKLQYTLFKAPRDYNFFSSLLSLRQTIQKPIFQLEHIISSMYPPISSALNRKVKNQTWWRSKNIIQTSVEIQIYQQCDFCLVQELVAFLFNKASNYSSSFSISWIVFIRTITTTKP